MPGCVLDAYFGAEIPPQLATLEFMYELSGVLAPGWHDATLR